MMYNLLKKHKFVLMSALLAVLIIVLIFVVVHFYSNDSLNESNDSESEPQFSQALSSGDLSGDSCFLVVCNDDSSHDILFMFLVDFRIYSASIIITPLSPETVVPDGRNYDKCYSYGGINTLIDNVETVRNIEIDRYAVLDRDGMSGLTELMGKVELYAEEDFTYHSSDKSYEVKTGDIEMGSDMLFTYLALYAERNGSDKTAELICDIINVYLSSVERDDAKELFLSLTNCFSTDVTISDYYSAESDIEYLLNHNVKCIIANDVDS